MLIAKRVHDRTWVLYASAGDTVHDPIKSSLLRLFAAKHRIINGIICVATLQHITENKNGNIQGQTE